MRRTGWVIAVLGCCLLVGALVIPAMAQDAVVTQARPGIQAKMLTDQEMDQVTAGSTLSGLLDDFWNGLKLAGSAGKLNTLPGDPLCTKGCTITSINMVPNPNYPPTLPKKIQDPNFQAGVNAMVQAGIALCKGPLGCK